jgi:hypothetical protein
MLLRTALALTSLSPSKPSFYKTYEETCHGVFPLSKSVLGSYDVCVFLPIPKPLYFYKKKEKENQDLP